jgi:hypothetical protein
MKDPWVLFAFGHTIPLVYSEDMTDPISGPPPSPEHQTPKPNPNPALSTGTNLEKPWIGWVRMHKSLVIAAAAVLLIGGGAIAWSLTMHKKPVVAAMPTPTPTHTPTPTPTPSTKASPLTGLQLTPDQANQPIVGVIIENHPDARPQSGLQNAGVVYEANAEGGITRFEAFFLDSIPPTLGPVRSLRTYFVSWGLEFNAPISHAGGNADALDMVGPKHMKDINGLSFASDGFYRTTDRYAPHNLYTNNQKLAAVMSRLGYNVPSSFTPSPRKADAPNANPPHPRIHIDYSYSGYQVDYTYDPATNDYARNLAGTPHIDRNTGKQIHVKNVVIEMMPTSYGTTRIGEQTVIMQTVGKGSGWVCHDGDCIPITWQKDSDNARTKLIGPDGKDTPLDAGNTWYSIVPVGKSVTL